MDLDNAPKDDALGAMQRERDKARAERDALLPLARFGRWCLQNQDFEYEDAEDAAERLGLLARDDGVFLRETDAAKVLDE